MYFSISSHIVIFALTEARRRHVIKTVGCLDSGKSPDHATFIYTEVALMGLILQSKHSTVFIRRLIHTVSSFFK